MTERGDSREALSGVVMGKTAGAALVVEGAAESAPCEAVKVDGGALVARILRSQGVKYLFAVNGGHTWPILAALRDYGIKLIHMRHEQSCAYAADGWARTTGTAGVRSVTAGCGLTNAVTGLCTASLAGSAELREFVELTKIPVYARRSGQGAVAEDHPLAIRGPWKKSFTGRADAVLAIGFRFWSGEKFGEAPTWSESALYIQADATPARIGLQVPAEVAIVGDAKLVLRQLCDAARANDWKGLGQSGWLQEVADVRTNFDRVIVEQEHKHHDDTPIHPARIARELCAVIDPDATIVIDSFTMSGWMSQWFHARFPGQILDAGPLAPVGHGIGMAIGAQLARPGKQVVLVIGDGGLGISGFDLETARRYGLPIVAVLWNNSSWGPSFDQMPFPKDRTDPFEMLPNQRYDRMFEFMDCHGEHVERPEEFRPALERALRAGKTALVNVVGDRAVGHPSLGGNLLGSTSA